MDDIDWRPKPVDPPIDPAVSPQKKGNARNRKTKARRPTFPETGTGQKVGFASLVERDGLFVCIVRDSIRDALGNSAVDNRGLQAAVLTLRSTFTAVWDRIPWRDRHQLFAYWQDPQESVLFRDRRLPLHRPLIRILDIGLSSSPYPECSKLGHILSFPLLYIREQPKSLHLDIARLLMQVQRYITRQHYQLILDMIEEPLAEWEGQQESEVCEVVRAAKVSELEVQFLRQHDAAMAEGLLRWGFAVGEREVVG